ncbi:ACP S-malonyltransferase [Spirillospora sp. NPDC048911]|uniref:ACP S-malonyltransferase n=1 Tax=Spirillospora sp. NPDC048911 TaxID=3364527 RepID=UPI00371FFB5C
MPAPSASETVFVVPGQGGNPRGALLEVYRACAAAEAEAEQVLEPIQRALEGTGAGPPLRTLLLSESRSVPARPGVPQLAGYTVSVVLGRLLTRALGPPAAIVGLSFGEIAALVCARAFDVADGTRAVCALNAAFAEVAGQGAMVLLPRVGEAECRRLLAATGRRDLVLACVNAPDQTVVSGPLDAIEALLARPSPPMVRLAVPYASHHPALTAVADRFRKGMSGLPQRRLRIPVHSPVRGRAYHDGDDLRQALADCVTNPLDLPGTLRRLGPGHRYVELGVGDALTRCVRKTLPGARALAPLGGDLAWLRAALSCAIP